MDKHTPKTSEAELFSTIFDGIDDERKRQIDEICQRFRLAVGVVARLRGPKGCPWDREQDHLTLRPYLIEEAYEVLDVLDRYTATTDPKALARQSDPAKPVPANGAFAAKDQELLREELGDLLLQVLLHAQLASERGEFSSGDVAAAMAGKLVSRHPHVFGETKVSGSEQVLVNWESIKKKEGKKGLLDGLPKNLPSLQRAARIGEKAHRVGFDWKDWKGSWDKVEEEIAELRKAIDQGQMAQIEHEIGDVFFSVCNLSRHLGVQPEDAHRRAIERFEKRFHRLEQIANEEKVDIQHATLEKLDEIWDRVKKEGV